MNKDETGQNLCLCTGSKQAENWEADSASNQPVLIKVQRSEDGKNVLVSWKYGESEFGIQAAVLGNDADITSIPKTAVHIINNLK